MFDWTNAVNDVCTAVVTVAALVGANKRWPGLFRFATFVEQHAAEIVQTAETVVKDIDATPAGVVIKHQLQSEVDKLTDKVKESEVGRLVLVGLHSFGNVELSDIQKQALVKFVSDNVTGGATTQQVEEAISAVQKAAGDFGQLEIVKSANYFTSALKEKAVPPQQSA